MPFLWIFIGIIIGMIIQKIRVKINPHKHLSNQDKADLDFTRI